jgi:predicted phage baseplate assembly protein
VFTTALAHSYRLDSVTIYGNVALATHGETVGEVSGAGDASKPYQRFTLRQPPLTFVRSADTASGAASTLTVRVNDLLWREVPSFYGRRSTERIFVTVRDDEGRTTVQFGDGVHGARLPTGQENVRATYRKGVGAAGNVNAGQLTNVLTKPLGLKSATNPRPAAGGDDPEPRDGARENAPLTVLTLDRVVSLRDYEDFARAYAGIAKSLATWSWDGERRGVFITVAGPHGAPVADDIVTLLVGAIRQSGDPFVPLRVGSFRHARFSVAFKTKIDAAYEKAKVNASVVDALRTRFGFAARSFGQSVSLSEVIAVMQGVAGVTAVDVDSLVRKDGIGASGLVNPLPAALPQTNSLMGSLAAELLTLSDDPIAPGDMT